MIKDVSCIVVIIGQVFFYVENVLIQVEFYLVVFGSDFYFLQNSGIVGQINGI